MKLHTKSANETNQDQGEREGSEAGRCALPPEAPAEEHEIRDYCEDANFSDATRVIFDQYGGEVRAFLNARTRTRASMEDVFSSFSEDVWKGLPSFRFQGKVRSWVYTVARNALFRHSKSRKRWGSRHVPSELDDMQTEVRRSITTQLGDVAWLEPVLSALELPDRRLLEQRLVLSMPWRDIAAECAAERAGKCAPSERDIERESARLRKRYQILLERLRGQLAATRVSEV